MNQKGAHLRQSFDLGTYISAMPSPTPTTSAVLPVSPPPLHPTPTLSAPSPTAAVASSDSASLDQLFRDIDSRAQAQTHLPSLLIYFHHFSRRLPRRSNIHSFRRTCHQLWGHAREAQYHIHQGNIDSCDSRTLNKNFYSGGACSTSNYFLHHRHRRAVNLTWPCAASYGRRRSRRPNSMKTLLLKT